MTEPLRTCAGCGRKAPQRELLRFVRSGGALTLDRGRRLPGRGVYTCRGRACFERARSRGSFAHTLRGDVRVPRGLNQVFEED